MYQSVKREKIDPLHPYLPIFYGVFEQEVWVCGRKRRMLIYIPEDVREATSGIIVLGENGTTADELLHNSPWCDMADRDENKEKFVAIFLEPEDGIWHTEEAYGKLDGDVAYIQAAADYVANNRYLFCVHEAKRYIVGCKEGGVLAQMAVANNPTFYAGLASIGAAEVPAAYLQTAGAEPCTALSGFIDSNGQLGLKKKDIAMPVWLVDDPATQPTDDTALRYWCATCGAQEQPRQITPDTNEYFRTKPVSYAPNQHLKAHRVWHSVIANAADHHAARIAYRIWHSFLTRQRRWLGSPTGDLRVWHEPVEGLGLEYHYEEFEGWMREWYIYVPESVKRHPEKKVPLVLAMHGYTCNGEIYANHTEWHRIAEQNQFIVLFPTALYGVIDMKNDCIDPHNTPLPAWNIFEEPDRPDELHFFTMLLDRMCRDYPVDADRIFATGHSWGSLMTQMLALAMPERFAAVAPCSGVFFGGAEERMLPLERIRNRPDLEIPVWMFCGEEEDFLIHATPQKDNETGFNIEMWLRNNHMAEQIPANWDDVAFVENGQYHDRFFDKNGASMVRFTSIPSMGHSIMTSMSIRIWDEFFSHFSRQNGTIRYKK